MTTEPRLDRLGHRDLVVHEHRAKNVRVYSLFKHELDGLQATSSRENMFFGVFTACASAALAAILAALVALPAHPVAIAIYVGVTGCLILGALVTGKLWRISQRETEGTWDEIRSREATTRVLTERAGADEAS